MLKELVKNPPLFEMNVATETYRTVEITLPKCRNFTYLNVETQHFNCVNGTCNNVALLPMLM